MNSISDEKIELELPPLREKYIKNTSFVYNRSLKNYTGMLKLLLIFWWLIVIVALINFFHYQKIFSVFELENEFITSALWAVTPFLSFIIFTILYSKLYKRNFGKDSYLEKPSKLYADNTLIKITSFDDNFKVEYTWQYVIDVTENKPQDIIILCGNAMFQILPKEIFANEDQRQQVFNQLTIWHTPKLPLLNELE